MNLYYTADHEWINFQGSIAITGVCAFKLTGFRDIEKIVFHEADGMLLRGETIATIHYRDYVIDARMPVDGKIIEINSALQCGNQDRLLRYPESSGWIARISPASPYERKGLILLKDYQMNGKGKHAKS